MTIFFSTEFGKVMVLQRNQLDIGVWAQLKMSLMGSNSPLRIFCLFPLNLSPCAVYLHILKV